MTNEIPLEDALWKVQDETTENLIVSTLMKTQHHRCYASLQPNQIEQIYIYMYIYVLPVLTRQNLTK